MLHQHTNQSTSAKPDSCSTNNTMRRTKHQQAHHQIQATSNTRLQKIEVNQRITATTVPHNCHQSRINNTLITKLVPLISPLPLCHPCRKTKYQIGLSGTHKISHSCIPHLYLSIVITTNCLTQPCELPVSRALTKRWIVANTTRCNHKQIASSNHEQSLNCDTSPNSRPNWHKSGKHNTRIPQIRHLVACLIPNNSGTHHHNHNLSHICYWFHLFACNHICCCPVTKYSSSPNNTNPSANRIEIENTLSAWFRDDDQQAEEIDLITPSANLKRLLEEKAIRDNKKNKGSADLGSSATVQQSSRRPRWSTKSPNQE